MVKPDDLLDKADALMARHRPPRAAAEPSPDIPVLNEVVELPHEGDDVPVLTELVLPAAAEQERFDALVANIRAALLAELQPEIDALVNARLKDGLAPLVERILHEVRGDLQLTKPDTLGDAIRAAVDQALERRKSGG